MPHRDHRRDHFMGREPEVLCTSEPLLHGHSRTRGHGERNGKGLVTQLCPTLRDPTDCSPPGSSVLGILHSRILEWVAFPPPGDLPDPVITPGPHTLQAGSSLSSHLEKGSLYYYLGLFFKLTQGSCFRELRKGGTR